jgi:hypothetical protein
MECQNCLIEFNFQEAMDRKSSDSMTSGIPMSNFTGPTIGQIPILYFSFDEEHEVEVVDL